MQLGRTPSFSGPRGEPVPGSIAEIKYLRLGGVDQWVMMRGESIAIGCAELLAAHAPFAVQVVR